MFLFNAKQVFHRSWRIYFTDSDALSLVTFHSGPIPATLEDVPFDLNDHYQRFRHCDYAQTIWGYHADDDGVQPEEAYTRYKSYVKLDTVRRHHLDRYGRWQLKPREIIHGGYRDHLTGVPLNTAAHDDNETQLRSLHFAYYYSNIYRGDEWDEYQYTNNFSGATVWNRSAQNAPLIFEFDQDVTANSFEYYSWTSSNNAPRFFTVEVYNPTGGDGSGAWEATGNDNLQMWDTFYGRTLVDFETPVTGSRIRITFSDTGSSNWALNHISLHGEEPTWGKDPVDLTWALVTGFHSATSGYYNRNITESFVSEGNFPYLLADVGLPGSGATIELAETTGLVGSDAPNIENFTLEFKDN